MPIHVEILYNEYAYQASFALASLLALVAVGTLVLQAIVERRGQRVAAPAAPTGAELPL